MTEYIPYLFIAVGVISLLLAIFGKSTKSSLKETGIPVEGIIYNQEFSKNNGRFLHDQSSYIKDKITIRFVTESGEWITGIIKQDFGISYSGQYQTGDTIMVYYNKANPSEFYVDTKQSVLIGKLAFGLIGLILISLGLYQHFVN